MFFDLYYVCPCVDTVLKEYIIGRKKRKKQRFRPACLKIFHVVLNNSMYPFGGCTAPQRVHRANRMEIAAFLQSTVEKRNGDKKRRCKCHPLSSLNIFPARATGIHSADLDHTCQCLTIDQRGVFEQQLALKKRPI